MKSSAISNRNLFSHSEAKKIELLDNRELLEFISHYTDLMEPSSVFIVTDSENDYEFIRK